MNRPSNYRPNPQAMAAASAVRDGDTDTWLTPRWILDNLGVFDLDPCAAEQNRDWIAARNFVRRDDGLSRRWDGRVFMNPPFSNTAAWLRRMEVETPLELEAVPA